MSGSPRLPAEDGYGRTLKTAVSALQVLRMVEQRSQGVSPEEVAQILAKSESTATYLLNSLCKEGFAYHDPETGRFMATRSRRDNPHALSVHEPEPRSSEDRPMTIVHDRLRDAVDELYGMTRARSYLATTDADSEAIVVQEMRGRQGLPTVPGLQPTIRCEAHALALGKALLAQRPDGARAYVDAYGLKAFTPRTITSPRGLEDELEVVRRAGYAVDREEYAEGIWCLAVPIYTQSGDRAAALGISLSRGQVGERHRNVLSVLNQVAREVQAESQNQVARVAEGGR